MTLKPGFWLLPLLLLGSSLESRAQKTLQVAWQNTRGSPLRDQNGKTLSAGAPASGDGTVVQLGYYSRATAAAPFEGTFIPLTGQGAANSALTTTSIGDASGGPDGRFSLASPFEADSLVSGFNLPPAGTPLSVRFFNGKTIASSTHFNAVSGGTRWLWQPPAAAPGEVIALSLADPSLLWKGGAASSLRTAVSCAVVFDTPPQDQSVSSGQNATFTVSASGLEPLFFQWRKGGVPIKNATAASYTLQSAKAADAGLYDVLVSNPSGSFRSAPAALKVDQIRGGFLIDQPADLSAIKSSKTTQTILLQPDAPEVASTQYQLLALSGGIRSPVPGLGGVVPPSGILPLAVRSLTTAGDYVLHFKRTFKDGSTEEIDSEEFQVSLKTWDDAAGTYEALLQDVNNLPADNARYRGAISLTLSRTGAISGKLAYTEAAALPGAEAQGLRSYIPVTRRFNGVLAPVDGSELKFVCVPILGTGLLAHRQDLLLELDATTTPPTLKATVRDHASVGGSLDSDGILSQSAPVPRALLKLPATAAGLAGNYPLHSDTTAYVQLQILASGKALWLTRSDGYSGSGSASVLEAGEAQYTAVLAESAATNSSATLNTRSFFGPLTLSRLALGTWSASIGTSTNPGALEFQASTLSRVQGAPTYDALKFASGENRSEIRSLPFTNTANRLWGGALAATAPDFLKTGARLLLKAHDPLSSGTATTLQWSLTVSTAGVVKSTPLQTGSTTAPALSLRLDKIRAGLTGSYLLPGDRLRRTLTGIAFTPDPGSSLRAQGWTEAGIGASLRTGLWTLELQP